MDDSTVKRDGAEGAASPRRIQFVLALVPMGALMLSLSRGKNLDFDIYRNSLIGMVHGASVYAFKMHWDAGNVDLGFLYPPFASLLMLPFALLPRTAGAMTLALVTALLVAAAVIRLVEELNRRRAGEGRPPIGALKVAVVATPLALAVPTISNMTLGQVSFSLWALALLDVLVLPRTWRGVLVGVAAAIKLTPMILVPYYLVTRQWRAAVMATGTFALATLLGALTRWSDSLTYWLHPSVINSSLGNLARVDNWLLYGLLSRLGVSGTPRTLSWLVLSAVVFVAALWRARGHFQEDQQPEAVILMGLAASLVSFATWPHHLLFLVVAIALLAWQRPAVGAPLLVLAVGPAIAALAGLPEVPAGIEGNVAVVLMVILVLAGLPRTGVQGRRRQADGRVEPSVAGQ